MPEARKGRETGNTHIFFGLTLTFLTHHSYVTEVTEQRFVRSCKFSPGTLIFSHREVGSSSR